MLFCCFVVFVIIDNNIDSSLMWDSCSVAPLLEYIRDCLDIACFTFNSRR